MKRNNNIVKYIIVTFVFLVTFSSCSEDFLDVSNPNQLALSSFYKTPQDAQFAVNICYTPQMHQGLFGRNWFHLFGTFEDRILYETTGLDLMNITSADGFSEQMFRDCYRMLWRSSHVIHNIELNQETMGLSDEDVTGFVAQLKAIQGMAYFFLVTIYNRPYFYDEDNLPVDPEELYGNSDPIQFWQGLQSSLEFAMENLPESWPSTDLGRITSGGAKALLGKAMLWKYYHYYMRFGITDGMQEDLEYAKQLLGEVISSGTYDLMQPIDPSNRTDVINAFECNFAYIDLPSSDATQMYDSENNKESVWEIQYNDERPQNPYLPGWLSTGNLLTQYYSPHLNSFKNHEVNPSLYYAFEDVTGHPAGFSKDPRLYGTLYMDGDLMDFRDVDGDGNPSEYTIPYVTGTNNKAVAKNRGLNRPGQPSEGFGLKKYHYPTYQEGVSPLCSPVNVRYIRFSDVLLLYAEASMLADNDADGTGLAALNRVRARVGMPPKAALTPQVIMNEREYELSLEGHRFLDLVRWSFDPQFGIDWNTLDWGLPYNPFTVGKNEYLPLPQGEIDVNNGALEQNPGW